RKNEAVPPPPWALRLALPLVPAALMAFCDPRRRPALAAIAYGVAVFAAYAWFLSTLPAYAPLVPRGLETAAALALTVVYAAAASRLSWSATRSSRAWAASARWSRSHHRADDPGRELFLADARELALRALARRHRDHFLEDLTADRRDRRALEDDPAVDVHVLRHVAVHQRVGRELDRRDRLAPENPAAPGGGADDVAPPPDPARDRHRGL